MLVKLSKIAGVWSITYLMLWYSIFTLYNTTEALTYPTLNAVLNADAMLAIIVPWAVNWQFTPRIIILKCAIKI